MKLYADAPARRSRQLFADVGMVLWAIIWIWMGLRMFDLVQLLAAPGEALTAAGTSLSENMSRAGEAIDGVPVVGSSVRSPFDRMSDTGVTIADAGRGQQEVVAKLALFAGLCVALIPIATLTAVWLPLRLHFVRRATAAQHFIASANDLDLFALRALTRQPMHVLARISSDPADQWRRKDPEVVRALAELELREHGLRLPSG